MKKAVLQVALDVLELKRALQIAQESLDGGADWIEVGTPLIKSEGMQAVRMMKDRFPDITLVADMKVADTGTLEVEMAAKAGARYVSPFVGRLDDIAHDGMELTQQILDIYDNYEYDTEVIVASIRHPKHVLDAALMGADIATIPFKVIVQLAQHPLTDKGIALFLEDWKKVPKK